MSVATAPVPTLSLAGAYIVSKTAATLVDMALHHGLKEEYDDAFLVWLDHVLRSEFWLRRAKGEQP